MSKRRDTTDLDIVPNVLFIPLFSSIRPWTGIGDEADGDIDDSDVCSDCGERAEGVQGMVDLSSCVWDPIGWDRRGEGGEGLDW